MRGRANINEEHVECDKNNNVRWMKCRAERWSLALRVAAMAADADEMRQRYEAMCDEYGLRDQGRNGVQGAAHGHAIWRLFRTAGNSLHNLNAKLKEL